VLFRSIIVHSHLLLYALSFLTLLQQDRYYPGPINHPKSTNLVVYSTANPRTTAHAHTKPSPDLAGLSAAPVTGDVEELGGAVRVGLAPPPPLPLPLLVAVTRGGVADGGGSEGEGGGSEGNGEGA
jgi:hypothetical protein